MGYKMENPEMSQNQMKQEVSDQEQSKKEGEASYQPESQRNLSYDLLMQ